MIIVSDPFVDAKEELIAQEKDRKKGIKDAEKKKELEGINLQSQAQVVGTGVGKCQGTGEEHVGSLG